MCRRLLAHFSPDCYNVKNILRRSFHMILYFSGTGNSKYVAQRMAEP